MSTKFQKILLAGSLLALAGSVLRLWVSGKLLYYIHPSTSWWVGSGAIVILIITLLWVRNRPDHLHIPQKQLVGLAIISAIITFSPNVPLSAAFATKREGGLGAPVSSRSGIKAGAATQEFTILDWLAAWESDPTYQRYVGSKAQVVGFITNDDGKFYINRYMVTCCAVDAQLLRIRLSETEKLPQDAEWVKLTGVMQRDGELPVISIQEVETVAIPTKPYLY
jgi:uncharacterized repeat protein (TIGR03943 family)